jgi:hypothetical protein
MGALHTVWHKLQKIILWNRPCMRRISQDEKNEIQLYFDWDIRLFSMSTHGMLVVQTSPALALDLDVLHVTIRYTIVSLNEHSDCERSNRYLYSQCQRDWDTPLSTIFYQALRLDAKRLCEQQSAALKHPDVTHPYRQPTSSHVATARLVFDYNSCTRVRIKTS